MTGDLLTHSWQRNASTPLGMQLADVRAAEILFIHDPMVATADQGLGVGRRLIENAFDLAARDGMRSVELIAVEGAAGFVRPWALPRSMLRLKSSPNQQDYQRGARWMGRATG